MQHSLDANEGSISPSPEPVRSPRLTVRYDYTDTPLQHTVEVAFRLSPSYGIWTVDDAHGWFRRMMREHEEFEVETDEAGALPLSFWSQRVRQVVVE